MNGSSDKKNEPWWRDSILLFSRLSGWIGVPVIAALFLGRWLDRKYDSEPWLFLISVGIAFAVSLIGIVKESKSSMEEILKKEANKKQKGEDKKNIPK